VEHKTSESSKIYADFTLSRINPKVKSTLSQEQLTELRRALIAQSESSKHTLDLRFTVNLLFSRYYFVILGGKDRRRRTIENNQVRKEKAKEKILTAVMTTFIVFAMIYFFTSTVKFLYQVKRDLGIDFFENLHAEDVIKKIIDAVL
jgi:hypothetical protein